jgi:two-component system, chemotaxis family, chemotaxis protein CheY
MTSTIDLKKKVLVVDDFSTMRKIVRNVLKDIGFSDIVEANDGIEALNILKNEKVSLVVTDWNMPKMNGLQLLENIRGNPANNDIPVLMVTAEGLKENIIQAVQAGVDNYVVKPFTAEIIKEKIEQIFHKRKCQK